MQGGLTSLFSIRGNGEGNGLVNVDTLHGRKWRMLLHMRKCELLVSLPLLLTAA